MKARYSAIAWLSCCQVKDELLEILRKDRARAAETLWRMPRSEALSVLRIMNREAFACRLCSAPDHIRLSCLCRTWRISLIRSMRSRLRGCWRAFQSTELGKSSPHLGLATFLM